MNKEKSFSDQDTWLFKEGSHFFLYRKLGSHLQNPKGCQFSVWAPSVVNASVIGDFNDWETEKNVLQLRSDGSGIWEGFVPEAKKGDKYKYCFRLKTGDILIEKADPYAIFSEQPRGNASIVWDLNYSWQDKDWMEERKKRNSLQEPISIYEVHLPSWKRVLEEGNRPLTYLELAKELPKYVKEMGFTHVEFLPIMEHPLYGSWGYQTVGYFAPTSRYGTPQEFMHLIDALHQAGIGVILDWVPAHFPGDAHGLSYFDGTHLYEYENPKKGMHPDWHTFIFDYDNPQVRSFLISNAFFWLEKYHADALRVDAVASMLYLDYSRKPDEWIPNIYGGRENLDAIQFLRRFNQEIYARFPNVQTIAEESTDWPMVSRPTYMGGLGFGMKGNMGWMHDILQYMSLDPFQRKYNHNSLLFSFHYAFSENFLLSLSHDEVVYGKGSLLRKMPGDTWQKFANLRLLIGYQFAHPGKKLLFMGGEFGQWDEWNHEKSLDWHLLEDKHHSQLQALVKDLNHIYKSEPALYENDFSIDGFEWIDTHDWEQSVISFLRKGKDSDEVILVVCNFTPVPRFNYSVGVPRSGFWKELLNSDAHEYGGSGLGNMSGVNAQPYSIHGRSYSVALTLPPLSIILFKIS